MTTRAPNSAKRHLDPEATTRRRSPDSGDDHGSGSRGPAVDTVSVQQKTGRPERQLESTTGEDGAAASFAKPFVFMVMPFGVEDLQIVYDDFVKPVVELRCGLDCIRGDDVTCIDVIMEDVSSAIRRAKVVIADLTSQNPNVCYEVGIAHEHGTPTLLLAQSVEDVPFDLRHRRVLIYEYSPRGCKRLESQLEEHLRQMLELLACPSIEPQRANYVAAR